MAQTDIHTGGEFGRRTAADAVRIERMLPGPIERVWRYLTVPELRRRWLAAGAFDLAPGGTIELVFHNDHLTANDDPAPERFARFGEEVRLHGVVTACAPPTLLAFTWGTGDTASHVRFDLAEADGRVRLAVTHERLANTGEMAMVAAGWHTHLDLLVELAGGGEPEGFWRRFAALEPVYRQRIGAA